MKVTIITLYRGSMAGTFVAVVEGDLTKEQEQEVAKSIVLETEDGEASDILGFCTMDVVPLRNHPDLLNAFPDGCTYDGLEDDKEEDEDD